MSARTTNSDNLKAEVTIRMINITPNKTLKSFGTTIESIIEETTSSDSVQLAIHISVTVLVVILLITGSGFVIKNYLDDREIQMMEQRKKQQRRLSRKPVSELWDSSTESIN